MPREIVPGCFYMISRRCTQREFLLRPDAATNAAFIYCLALAAKRSGVDVILPVVMSNHHHTIVYDRRGEIVRFIEYLHRLVAKSQNALRGRSENLWTSEQSSLLRLVEPADVLAKLIYAATNPVKDDLVEQVHHWPGVNGLSALLNDRPLTATRPRHYFRSTGRLPREVSLRLAIPPELGDAESFRNTLRECVAAAERRFTLERHKAGRRVVGRRAILQQSWRGRPSSPSPQRGINPRVAARSVWSRVEALARNRAFLDAYRAAWLLWRAGVNAVFPAGTYWLQRFAHVPVAAPSTS